VIGDVWGQTVGLSNAIMAHAPAVLVLLSFAVVLFGALPRFYTPLVWSALGACLLIYQLGAVLKLPEWITNISPFSHTPGVPAASVDFTPLWIMSVIAVGLLTLGLALYRRRDLVTE
jgi:ABC-2 type transport system permease protein